MTTKYLIPCELSSTVWFYKVFIGIRLHLVTITYKWRVAIIFVYFISSGNIHLYYCLFCLVIVLEKQYKLDGCYIDESEECSFRPVNIADIYVIHSSFRISHSYAEKYTEKYSNRFYVVHFNNIILYLKMVEHLNNDQLNF